MKWGNSIVQDPQIDVLSFDWEKGTYVKSIFDPPTAAEAAEIDARWREGFDVVIGNPPYVRQELLGKINRTWRRRPRLLLAGQKARELRVVRAAGLGGLCRAL